MRRHWILQAGVVLALVLTTAGCSLDDNEHARGVIEVVAVNEGAPFIDGQINVGGDKQPLTNDDFVPTGHVPVTVRSRDYNAFINAPAQTPYGQFNITQVQVEWQPLATGTAADALPAFNRIYNFNVSIPKDTDVTFNVMLVTFEMKQQPFLRGLLPPAFTGGADDPSFQAQAHVTLIGHDSGAPDALVTVECTIPVEFIGLII